MLGVLDVLAWDAQQLKEVAQALQPPSSMVECSLHLRCDHDMEVGLERAPRLDPADERLDLRFVEAVALAVDRDEKVGARRGAPKRHAVAGNAVMPGILAAQVGHEQSFRGVVHEAAFIARRRVRPMACSTR